jgi:hypothetical protein
VSRLPNKKRMLVNKDRKKWIWKMHRMRRLKTIKSKLKLKNWTKSKINKVYLLQRQEQQLLKMIEL